jgi:hypothetical protein
MGMKGRECDRCGFTSNCGHDFMGWKEDEDAPLECLCKNCYPGEWLVYGLKI